MAERLFLFVQLELPWELGPADGRYLLRGATGEPEHVVVLGTVGAARRPGLLGGRRRRPVAPEPEPTPVAVTRATVIDPVAVATERQARAWLDDLRDEHEAWATTGVLNGMLMAHRLATADAYMHEVSPRQALTVRAGWGGGEQVADGHWDCARELSRRERGGRREATLRPQERLAAFLGGREAALLCEELTLRARRDLDQGRARHAAVELEGAYRAALAELGAEGRADLAQRVAELRDLHPGVERASWAALGPGDWPATETIGHALERLEAALRARTAAGLAGGS